MRLRLKASLWWASCPEPLKLPWLWCARCAWRRCGGGTRGWAAVEACGSWEETACQQQLAGRSPTRLSSCAQPVGGRRLHRCFTAGRGAGRPMGGGPGTGDACLACCLPLWHSRSVLTQKGFRDCCLALEKFPLIWSREPCLNKNLWIYPDIEVFCSICYCKGLS